MLLGEKQSRNTTCYFCILKYKVSGYLKKSLSQISKVVTSQPPDQISSTGDTEITFLLVLLDAYFTELLCLLEGPHTHKQDFGP